MCDKSQIYLEIRAMLVDSGTCWFDLFSQERFCNVTQNDVAQQTENTLHALGRRRSRTRNANCHMKTSHDQGCCHFSCTEIRCITMIRNFPSGGFRFSLIQH